MNTKHKNLFRKGVSGLILLCFLSGQVLSPSAVYAQSVLALPIPGAMVRVSPSYVPIAIKGLKVYPDNPFRFDFILDTGNSKLQGQELSDEAKLLIKYFLTALTVPDDDQWVNLSPYEKDRIIPKEFGTTEMGRDLLAQDYLLKQLTASLIYPEQELGKKFWDRVHQKAYEKYGNVDIPVDTFNKVWIMPEHAKVYESGSVAFITESHLKVMLEEDYKNMSSLRKQGSMESQKIDSRFHGNDKMGKGNDKGEQTNAIGSQILREIVLPQIEKEVNEGKNFIKLRQIYHSMIMAAWFKRKLKNGMLGKIYVGANKVAGVEYTTSVIASEAKAIKAERSAENRSFSAEARQSLNDKELIYQQYLAAFKKGVYNYIKEEIDETTQETIPRKYFAGGFTGGQAVAASTVVEAADSPEQLSKKVAGSMVGELQTAEISIIPAQVARGHNKLADPKDFLNRIFNQGLGWVTVRDLEPSEVMVQRGLTGSVNAGNYFGDGVQEAVDLLEGKVDNTKRSVSILGPDYKDWNQLTDEVTSQHVMPFAMRFGVEKSRLEPGLSDNHAYVLGLQKKDIMGMGIVVNRLNPKMWMDQYLKFVESFKIEFTKGSDGEEFYNKIKQINSKIKLGPYNEEFRSRAIINLEEINELILALAAESAHKSASKSVATEPQIAVDQNQMVVGKSLEGNDVKRISKLNGKVLTSNDAREFKLSLTQIYPNEQGLVEFYFQIVPPGTNAPIPNPIGFRGAIVTNENLIRNLDLRLTWNGQYTELLGLGLGREFLRYLLESGFKIEAEIANGSTSRDIKRALEENKISNYDQLRSIFESTVLGKSALAAGAEIIQFVYYGELYFQKGEVLAGEKAVEALLDDWRTRGDYFPIGYIIQKAGKRSDDLSSKEASADASSQVTKPDKLGGIDMNQKALDLQTEGEGIKFDMPFDPTQLQNIQIDGFSPVILQIIPTNLPLFIGSKEKEDKKNSGIYAAG